MKTHFALFAGVSVLGVGGWVIGVDPPMIHHSSSTPSHSTHTSSSHHERVEMERRERAWHDWYYRTHRRYVRPGYSYPGGYPPGYTDTEPTPQTGTYSPGQSGTDSGTPQTTTTSVKPPAATDGNSVSSPGGNSVGSPGGSSVGSTPDAQPAPLPVDPDVQTDLDRVKKACAARADYLAAVADKKDAEGQLAELHRNETGTPETTSPLATRVLNAKKVIATIEREETAKAAKFLESQPPALPAASVAH